MRDSLTDLLTDLTWGNGLAWSHELNNVINYDEEADNDYFVCDLQQEQDSDFAWDGV